MLQNQQLILMTFKFIRKKLKLKLKMLRYVFFVAYL